MKKKIIITLFILIGMASIFYAMYAIDMYMMERNRKVIFSTWGYEYTTPEYGYQILEIEDNTKEESYTCDMALEKIYEDDNNEYYFSCIKSKDIFVKYVNGEKENIKSALNSGRVTIKDLDGWNIQYITQKKEDSNTKSFVATVLEEKTTYMIVKPEEYESEAKSADKIEVGFNNNHTDYLYGVGTRVRIYYDGKIMETYPARINAKDIFIID